MSCPDGFCSHCESPTTFVIDRRERARRCELCGQLSELPAREVVEQDGRKFWHELCAELIADADARPNRPFVQ